MHTAKLFWVERSQSNHTHSYIIDFIQKLNRGLIKLKEFLQGASH